MSKTIFIGDVHLNCGSFEPYVEDALSSILAIVQQEKPDSVVFLGDFLDSPTLNPDIAKRIAEWFAKFKSAAQSVTLITGNHDKLPRYNYASTDFLIEQGVTTGFDICHQGDTVLVSHSHSGKVAENVDGKVIAAHLGLTGVPVSNTYVYSHPDVLSYTGKPRAIILGHIHTPSDFIMGGVQVYIPGNICPCNWSDSSEQRFLVKDEDGVINTIPYRHIKTEIVYNIKDILNKENTIYRVTVSEEELAQCKMPDSVKSVVVQKRDKVAIKGLSKNELITSYCKSAKVDEKKVRKILSEAGVHA